jgi:predicted ATPase with chaperone activity
VDGIRVIPALGLVQVIAHVREETSIPEYAEDPDHEFEDPDEGRLPNLPDVRGQEHAKRALDSISTL